MNKMKNISLRPELEWFALNMERVLRENDWKDSWKNDTIFDLFNSLELEFSELINELFTFGEFYKNCGDFLSLTYSLFKKSVSNSKLISGCRYKLNHI